MVDSVRLVEVLAGLSFASDLGMGLPAEHAARTCLLAVRLAQELGVGGQQLADVFYVGLLRYVGCTADAHEVAGSVGDEIRLAAGVGPWVMGGDCRAVRRGDGSGGSRWPGRRRVGNGAGLGGAFQAAQMLADRLGLGADVSVALQHGVEHWDGSGHPDGLAGAAIPLPSRIAVVAGDVELWRRRGRRSVAADVVRRRRGRAYDPAVADAFLYAGARLMVDPDDAHPAALFAENRIR
jgi:hypothetical protein